MKNWSALALILLFTGCTSYQQSPINDWLRLHSATPTAVLPHTWYVGESWTRVESRDQSGEWVIRPRSGKSPLSLVAYPDRPFALAIENTKYDPNRFITFYWQSGTSKFFEVPEGFLNALPHISKETVLVFGLADRGDYRLDEYDRDGQRISRTLLERPQTHLPTAPDLRLYGFCDGELVLGPASWDQERWVLRNNQLIDFIQGNVRCTTVLAPSCVGACDIP